MASGQTAGCHCCILSRSNDLIFVVKSHRPLPVSPDGIDKTPGIEWNLKNSKKENAMHISEIDKNLKVEETVRMDDIVWRDADSPDFRIYGCCSVTPYRRLPKDVAEKTNEGVAALASNTMGVRVRLRTDSPYVAIHAEWGAQCCFSHMAGTGVSGFDMYSIRDEKHEFVGTFIPSFNCPHGYENILKTPVGMQNLIIDFPLYNDVDKLFIGVSDKASYGCNILVGNIRISHSVDDSAVFVNSIQVTFAEVQRQFLGNRKNVERFFNSLRKVRALLYIVVDIERVFHDV